MKNLALVLLCFCCSARLAATTECSVGGQVLFGLEEAPVATYEVELGFHGLDIFLKDTTDENGAFLFEFELEFNGPNPIFGTLSTTDFCTGEVLIETVILLANFPDVEGAKVAVCSNDDPPNPPRNCEAFLYYEQVEADPFLMQFYDVSSLANPAQAWFWEFGDGNTSTLANPLHEYSAPGIYEATLTIQADSCSSVFSDWVVVRASLSCACDEPYEPVCFTLPDGERLTWPNSCVAECEGFTSDQYEPCGVICQAEFQALQTSTPGLIQLQDQSTVFGADITAWRWEFYDGTGTVSTEQNPTHTFARAGMVDVLLSISTNGGCSSTLVQPVFVSVVSGTKEAEGELGKIEAFPNPVESRLTLNLFLKRSGRYQLAFSNTSGQFLQQQAFSLPAGEQQLELDISSIPAGLAILQLQGERGLQTLRIVKQ